MEKLFTISYLALNFTQPGVAGISVFNGIIQRDTEDEATGAALRQCREKIYPKSQGYFNHEVNLWEIPEQLLNDAGYFRKVQE